MAIDRDRRCSIFSPQQINDQRLWALVFYYISAWKTEDMYVSEKGYLPDVREWIDDNLGSDSYISGSVVDMHHVIFFHKKEDIDLAYLRFG